MAFLRILPVMMLLVACGCGRAQHTRPIVPPTELTPAERTFQNVWDSASEVLISYRFKVDQLDRRSGTVTTLPQGGRHFFEWWRRDKATVSGALENTVQPLYRTAIVRIIKKSDGEYHPVVTIKVSRLLSGPGQVKHPHPAAPGTVGGRKKDKEREYMVIAIGTSGDSAPASAKRSPGDDVLAKRIADEIRTLAYQKRTSLTR